jgi:hypothetical protein
LRTDSHELSSASGVRKPVRTISSRLMPSTPTAYSMPNAGNPGVALDELEVAGAGVEAAPQEQRLAEDEQRHDQRDLAHEWRALLLVAADVRAAQWRRRSAARRAR